MTHDDKRLDYLAKAKNAEEIAAKFAGGPCRKSWSEMASVYRDLAQQQELGKPVSKFLKLRGFLTG